jgi:Fe-S cluster biosynthesis and repair protein YggX
MSEQSQPESHQSVDVNDSSISKSNLGQVIGGNLTQIQGEVINVTVYDNVDVLGLGRRQTSGSVKPLTQQDYRNRKVLLNKVKKFWIEGVLEKSLHIKALIELGLEERLDAVERPFQDVQEIPEESRQTLPSGTDATQVFNQMGEGRTLLILGEPGAGKTTILLKLAHNLIARTEEDLSQPIPVVFNLSSWASERQTITDWLVGELNSQYQVSKKLGKAWVEEQQLLLLLDGLDEVKAERREACVQALNQFIQEQGQTEIMVCSRLRDYEALPARLKLQGAICIQSLTPDQINDYLERAGDQLEAVKTLLQEDTALQELAKSPLMLSVMTLAYQGFSIEELPKTGSVAQHRQHLLSAYIERMFKRRGAKGRYSRAQATHWLSWLAQKISQEAQSIFLIERMQPSWLQTKPQRTNFKIVKFIIFSLPLFFIVFFMIGDLSFFTLLLWLSLALIFALDESHIATIEAIKFDWKGLINNLIKSLVLWSISYSILWLFLNYIFKFWKTDVLFSVIFLGLFFGLPFGLFFGLEKGLKALNIETKILPNEGMWRSAMYAGIFGTISGLFFGLFFGLVGMQFFGLFFGLFLGLFTGKDCIQHFTLRLILYRNDFIPWNYARFLDYATDRIFLQKVGGGYIFIHRLLLEHFAQMELEQVRR